MADGVATVSFHVTLLEDEDEHAAVKVDGFHGMLILLKRLALGKTDEK
ncbi:MAG: hypothetical protein VX733_02745 [Candidatus Latescibacterota bacterium]|nr:hypothetical protein [Candidatus Latescibacterota bacterium]